LLTPLQEKVALLQRIGVEQLVLLPFDRELASLTPDQFVHDILVQKLQARRISVGQDFCFGRQRSGTALDLQAIAATYGIEVEIAPLQQVEGDRAGADPPVRISSSAIRLALQQGDLETANHLLGYPYCLVGNVVEGQQLGRVLGFPTANLQLRPEKFVPCQGVYAVRVQISQSAWPADQLSAPYIRGVMNLGNRPTVDGFRQVAEVHLFDWTGDLYGQTLIVSLERFLRPEQKFASLEELKSQIQIDCSTARMLLATIGHNGTDS
jgi:riboflavin kinase/FMN adenylyltransferase